MTAAPSNHWKGQREGGGGGRLLGANAGDGKSVAAAAHVQVLENWK